MSPKLTNKINFQAHSDVDLFLKVMDEFYYKLLARERACERYTHDVSRITQGQDEGG